LEIGFHSYKNKKEVLSSQIPLNLYRSYLKNVDILETNPSLLYEKFLSIQNNDVSNDKEIKIIVNNLLISRRTIIKTMALHQEKELITNLEKQIYDKSRQLSELNFKYDTSLPLVSSRKQRKMELKFMKREMINVDLDYHYSQVKKYELEISKLNEKFQENKIKLTKYIEGLENLNFIELFNEYEKIRAYINYDNYSINSPNKKYKKYKTKDPKLSINSYNIRQYSSLSLKNIDNLNNSMGSKYLLGIPAKKISSNIKSFNSKNILLNRIKNIINENPINNETQKLIEMAIYKYNTNLNDKSNNI
jgi:hypothetical protein